jgi:DNA polymerase-1
MELRVFSSKARCYTMIDIFKSGRDVHKMIASMCTDVEYDKIIKAVRYEYKDVSWTLLYGGDEHTLSATHGWPITKSTKMVTEYFRQFPEVREYLNECREFGEEHGYIESPFGRREHLPYIRDRQMSSYKAKDIRAAVNMPIQSSSSDILLMAMVVLDIKMEERNMKSMMVNTVHDSLVIDAHPDEVEELVELGCDVMANIPTYAKTYMPHIDFSWLICPLKADVEIGTHYGSKIDYEDWKKEQEEENG